MSQLLSGKVKVVKPINVSEDRYEYLRLNEAEPNLGVPISGSLSSGSIALVASDSEGNRLFVTTLQLDQVTGSFSGSFAGDGSDLNNLPEAVRLLSGSASASISPNTGFLVNVSSSFDGDMDVTGDVKVTGDLIVDNRIVARELIVEIISSSIIFSSGSNRFGEVSTDKQEFTGSVEVTGSLDVFGDTTISGSTFVSGNIQINSGSTFSGSGEDLFNIPRSALAPDSLVSALISTGSVTASVSTDGFFRVFGTGSVTTELSGSTFISGNLQLNSGSTFSGSGENLFNIPKSALTDDALLSNLITTGSVSASVSTDGFFRVFGTGSVTTELSGSLFVSGNVNLNSGSSFSGSGENLFNIPKSALTEDALETNLIISGAVTASVSPDTGFVVTSEESGSTFSGSIFLSSGSFFSGSGENLFNIPISALSDDALLSNLITSGSVSASVSPDGFFRVFSTGSVTTELSGSLFVSGAIQLNSGSKYSGSGENLFDIPRSALTEDALLSAFIRSGSVTASVSPDDGFVVTSPDSGSTFFGNITLSSGSKYSGSGEDLFDIPRSALTEDALISNLIQTGSVTASVSTDGFFRVQGTGSITTELSGSLLVSGNVEAQIGSFSGSGANLFDIPFSALSTDAQESIESLVSREAKFISSGSITASVDPQTGFVVESELSGSTFSGSVRLSSGSVFSGSGAELFDIPKSALVEDALVSSLIETGSVTASVLPDGTFKVFGTGSVKSEFSGSVSITETLDVPKIIVDESTGSFSGSFAGDGSELNNIPLSALSETSPLIASGSVTASVSPEDGFLVTSLVSGSTFSGSVRLSSGSIFSGSGKNLFDIPLSALSETSPLIASGSVTASTSPTDGFLVTSIASGSTFSGSVRLSSGSIFSGSGANLFDIPFSAITQEAFRIVSGSVTASVHPTKGFEVNSTGRFEDDVTISGSVFISSSNQIKDNLRKIVTVVSTDEGNKYFIDGQKYPNLYLVNGSTYTFDQSDVSNSTHPLKFSTTLNGIHASGSEYISGVNTGSIEAGTAGSEVSISVTAETPSTFYYYCLNHANMAGPAVINVVNEFPYLDSRIEDNLKIDGTLNVTESITTPTIVADEVSSSFFSGSGRDLFDIPQSALSEDAFQISSGSVTASVHPDRGFEVNSTGRFDGGITTSGSLIVSASTTWAPDNLEKIVKVIATDDGNKYEIDGYRQPLLYLVSGSTYRFNQSDVYKSTTHPLRFSTTEHGTHAGGVPFTGSVDTGSTDCWFRWF